MNRGRHRERRQRPRDGGDGGWINEVYDHGVAPGYEARWAEGWIQEQFTEIGLENVRLEPVPLKKWERPTGRSSHAEGGETTR